MMMMISMLMKMVLMTMTLLIIIKTIESTVINIIDDNLREKTSGVSCTGPVPGAYIATVLIVLIIIIIIIIIIFINLRENNLSCVLDRARGKLAKKTICCRPVFNQWSWQSRVEKKLKNYDNCGNDDKVSSRNQKMFR